MNSFFEIVIRDPNQFGRQLNRLPIHIKNKTIKTIEQLQFFPKVPHIKRLSNGGYRLRIADYRLLFDLDSKNRRIIVYEILHRKDAYRKL
jgi:mRNA interferase RelE/StbE